MQPGPQFQQLDMFKTAEELKDPQRTIPGDFAHLAYAGDERDAQGLARNWFHKENTAKERGLRRRVDESGGVEEPVVLTQDRSTRDRPELTDGHHRTATAYARNPKSLVPVLHRVRG